jgi:hypothetical protein
MHHRAVQLHGPLIGQDDLIELTQIPCIEIRSPSDDHEAGIGGNLSVLPKIIRGTDRPKVMPHHSDRLGPGETRYRLLVRGARPAIRQPSFGGQARDLTPLTQ